MCYNQVKPRDLFDLDFQASPILAEASIGGQMREVVIGSGKLGRIFAFDRDTCETLWETLVGEHQNDDLAEVPLDEEILVLPGVWGGVETPMAFADGVIYAQVLNLGTPYTATGFDAVDGTEAVTNASARTQLNTGTSEVVAVDANTGEILWTTQFDQPGFGAATVVNDLVFTSTFDGGIYALSREDGQVMWQFQAQGGINAWPAVVGDTFVLPVGVGDQPYLLALRLGAGGGEQQPPPGQVTTPQATP